MIRYKASAPSRLRSGVADCGNCWDASGHQKVSHAHEIRCAAVGGRAECLSGDPQDSQGIVAEVASCAAPTQGRCRGGRWSDVKSAEACNCRVQTIECLRKCLVTASFELALDGKQRQEPPTPCKLDGEAAAQRIAMRLGKPPVGDGHWTLPLLADAMSERPPHRRPVRTANGHCSLVR